MEAHFQPLVENQITNIDMLDELEPYGSFFSDRDTLEADWIPRLLAAPLEANMRGTNGIPLGSSFSDPLAL
jgi:hypothetical protein